MPPYRNPVEARSSKQAVFQNVADENFNMSSEDFNKKHYGEANSPTNPRYIPDDPVKGRLVHKRIGKRSVW